MKRLFFGILVYVMVPSGSVVLRLGIALAAALFLPQHKEKEGSISMDSFSVRQKLSGRLSWQKLAFFVSCLFLSLLAKNPLIHGFILISMLSFLYWLGLDLGEIFDYMTLPLSFILLSVFSLLLILHPETGDKVLFSLGDFLFITEASREQSYGVLMRALAGLSCLYGLSLSSSMGEILKVLSSFLPEKMMEILYMMYRFIFILLEFLHQMMRSAKARGGSVNFKRSLQSSGLIASSLLFRSMKQTERSYDALLARGYDGGLPLQYAQEPEKRGEGKLIFLGILYLGILILLLGRQQWHS